MASKRSFTLLLPGRMLILLAYTRRNELTEQALTKYHSLVLLGRGVRFFLPTLSTERVRSINLL